jgi:hypothetical protein
MKKVKYKNRSGIITSLLNMRASIIASNVIFQSIPYMSHGEKIYKLSLTIAIGLVIHLIFGTTWTFSIIIGHLVNYIINGQFYVLYRYIIDGDTMNYSKLSDILEMIKKYGEILKPKDILFTGSFSKSNMTGRSDLDIRIFHESSFASSLKAYILATTLRMIGLYRKYPIDIYCFSNITFLGPKRLHESEVPVHVYGHDQIRELYPTSPQLDEHIKSITIS